MRAVCQNQSTKMKTWVHVAAAMVAGLLLRLFFIAHFPFSAGDTKFYEELARNWLYHGVYGLFVQGQLIPVDMRMPGYPAFLAGVYAAGGRTRESVMVVQAILDLGTCALTGLITARLAPIFARRHVMIAAVWIAAVCPFTADYSAVMLTEVLATFLTTLTLLILVCILADPSIGLALRSLERRALLSRVGWWLLAGFAAGLGTLVRPETPLVLAAAGVILSLRWWRRADWKKLALAGLWMAVGLLLALLPWAVRNARTMGRVEFLGPRYAESKGDFIPRGFFAWTQTWMVRPREAYLVPWKLGKEPVDVESLPRFAFDSELEYARVEALLDQYNIELKMTPLLDREFSDVARERNARRPARTYLFIPMARAWMMWFTPRVGFLRYTGEVLPLGERWRGERTELEVTLGFGLLGVAYVCLAWVGAWRWRGQAGLAFLVTFVIIRTAFMTQLQTVEPRYVMACYPAILALGALAWARPHANAALATQHDPPLGRVPSELISQ
jgi:4-amino-4-deoxy-L-arabinose transferase-like glycosyltransferase